MRWLALFVLGLLAILLSATVWLPGWVRQGAQHYAQDTWHRRLEIGAIVFHPHRLALELDRVRLYDSQETPLASVDRAEVSLSWHSSLQGIPVLGHFELDHPFIHFVRRPGGSNWDFIEPQPNTPSTGLIAMTIEDLAIHDGEIQYDDPARGIHHRLSHLAATIPRLSTRPSAHDEPIPLNLNGSVDETRVQIGGDVRPFAAHPSARVRVEVTAFELSQWPRWLPRPSAIDNLQGRVSLHLDLSGSQPAPQRFNVQWNGPIQLNDLVVGKGTQSGQSVRLKQGTLQSQGNLTIDQQSLEALHLAARASLDSLDVNWGATTPAKPNAPSSSPEGHLERGAAQFDLDQHGSGSARSLALRGELGGQKLVLGQGRPDDRSEATLRGPKLQFQGVLTSGPFKAHLDQLVFGSDVLSAQTRFRNQPFTLNLKQPQLSVTPVEWPLGQNPVSQVLLNSDLGPRGHLTLQGPLDVTRGAGQLQIRIDHLDWTPFQPFLSPFAPLLLDQGDWLARGDLTLSPNPHGVPFIHYRGLLQGNHLKILDQTHTQPLFQANTLYLAGIDAGNHPLALHVGQLALGRFAARVQIMSNGQLNWQNPPPPSTPAVKTNTATQASAAMVQPTQPSTPVVFDNIELQGGRVRFEDDYIKPHYRARLTDLSGEIKHLSTVPNSRAQVNLRGFVNHAPLVISGEMNPLQEQRYLDLDAQVSGMDLPPFSPYADKYVGYEIERGKLSFKVHYHVEHHVLQARNQVTLDQLSFGKPVSSPTALDLPVRLAVDLLKDSNGVIRIDLPVQGSFDDPQFSMGSILRDLIVKTVEKAVASPFELLASVLEKHAGRHTSWVLFAPGLDRLEPSALSELQSLIKTMQEHPSLKLDLEGRASGAVDSEPLQRDLLQRRVREAWLKGHLGQGGPPPDPLPPDDYEQSLRTVYESEPFPKPRNFFGMVKRLPVTDMENLIFANHPITANDLDHLAQRRANRVIQSLIQAGIDGGRLYLAWDDPADKEIAARVSPTRVDLFLH